MNQVANTPEEFLREMLQAERPELSDGFETMSITYSSVNYDVYVNTYKGGYSLVNRKTQIEEHFFRLLPQALYSVVELDKSLEGFYDAYPVQESKIVRISAVPKSSTELEEAAGE